MPSYMRLAWQQLSHNRMKLVVATAGVVVAVMLMLVQLGIRQGAIDNSVAIPRRIQSELVVVSPRTKTIFQSAQFPRRLLYRIPAHPAVEDVQEVYMSQARFRNPWDYREYPISVFGLDPRETMLHLPGLQERAGELTLMDSVIFDGNSRSNFGPVTQVVKEKGILETEVNFRHVKVIDVIYVGISINTDGNLYTSKANFLRLFPSRNPGAIDLGLVRLKEGADAKVVAEELKKYLGAEAKILSRDELVASEIQFLRESAPLDFIFGMGAAVGFFIGFVVVYQILFTEVTHHLPQFATLKAMGFDDRYLLGVVLSQSFFLSVLGYIPGFFLALGLYQVATAAIQMPFSMTWSRGVGVFFLTVIMCGFSGMVAIQKVRQADPADVF